MKFKVSEILDIGVPICASTPKRFKPQVFSKTLLFAAALALASCGSGSQTLEDFRLEFINAGGVCTAPVPDSTTTTASDNNSNQSSLYISQEALDCGEDESSISRYDSEQSARASWWAFTSLMDGLQLAIADDTTDRFQIIKGAFRVNLPLEFTESDAGEIANKLAGYVASSGDVELRKKILSEVVESSTSGGLDRVAAACAVNDDLSSDGQSIALDTEGEDDSDGTPLISVFCILRATVAPDYIFDSIKQTRSLDGRVEEAYGEYRATWSYHPDDGLQLSLIFNE